jgi:hypothetical protein
LASQKVDAILANPKHPDAVAIQDRFGLCDVMKINSVSLLQKYPSVLEAGGSAPLSG